MPESPTNLARPMAFYIGYIREAQGHEAQAAKHLAFADECYQRAAQLKVKCNHCGDMFGSDAPYGVIHGDEVLCSACVIQATRGSRDRADVRVPKAYAPGDRVQYAGYGRQRGVVVAVYADKVFVSWDSGKAFDMPLQMLVPEGQA